MDLFVVTKYCKKTASFLCLSGALMDKINKRVGKFLMEQRNKKKKDDASFSVRGLAKKIGVSATYLSKIERGQVPASNEAIYKLAEQLQINPDEVFALANKIDPTVEKKLASHSSPKKMAAFLRSASQLQEKELDMLNAMIDAVVDKQNSDEK